MFSCQRPALAKKKFEFTPLNSDEFLAPVTRVTPDDGFYVHTYYDVSPFSPSQRYLAVTRLPYQDHNAVLGDTAEVCVIDLEEQTIETVYTTKCWAFQTGANVNWGGTDRYLYTNDVIDGTAVCVRLDLETGDTKAYAGAAYHVAPDDSSVIAFPLELLDVTQLGYGVPPKDYNNLPSLPPGAATDEGLWRTDLKTNERTLLVSLADIAAKVPEPPPRPGGTFYFWHCRFNPSGTRIHQISRCVYPDAPPDAVWARANTMVFTFNADGSDIRFLPTDPVWGHGGGHPNWHGDGEHLIRNLPVGGVMRFCQWHYDGSDFRVLSESLEGGGHPRIEPSGRYLVTDARSRENGEAKVNLRFIDFKSDQEKVVCALRSIDREAIPDAVLRLDGHPNWTRDFKKVILQAAPEGRRQLYLVDMTTLVS
jgi:hypothetical protein